MANVRFSHLCYNKSMLIIDEDLIEIDDLVENILQAFSCFPEVEAYRYAKTKFTEDEILQKKSLSSMKIRNISLFAQN